MYALTAAKIAGAVTQTSIYDYRIDSSSKKFSHFGAPLSSVEIYLKDKGEYKTSDTTAIGEVGFTRKMLLWMFCFSNI